MIDQNTEFGQRTARRLAEERIIWLTSVRVDGMPQPTPVWFLWTGQEFIIFSRSQRQKLRNIAHDPNVALNFDSDGQGGNIVVFFGEAAIDPAGPNEQEAQAYASKYAGGFRRIGMSREEFFQTYVTTIRIKPVKVRGH